LNNRSLAKNFEQTVALVHQVLSNPRFKEEEFEKVKSAALTSIKGREANPNSIAALSFNKLIYGEQHPLGLPSSGSTETVSDLSLEDVKSFYQRFFYGEKNTACL